MIIILTVDGGIQRFLNDALYLIVYKDECNNSQSMIIVSQHDFFYFHYHNDLFTK